MIPGNPQRFKSMITNLSMQLYIYVRLFTLGGLALVNTIQKLPNVNYVYGLLLLDYEVRLVCVRNQVLYSPPQISIYNLSLSWSPKHGEVYVKDKRASAKSFQYYISSNLHITKLEIFCVDCPFLSFKNAFYDILSKLGLTFTLNNNCKPPVLVWLIQIHLCHLW